MVLNAEFVLSFIICFSYLLLLLSGEDCTSRLWYFLGIVNYIIPERTCNIVRNDVLRRTCNIVRNYVPGAPAIL